jgi:DNA-binding IclR family transcriptional regulator
MKPSTLFLAALAPAAVLADPLPRANVNLAHNADTLAQRSPFATIPEPHRHHTRSPADSEVQVVTLDKRVARHILQARSEGSLGQTPWIGMAIGLTCTALAAVMLG